MKAIGIILAGGNNNRMKELTAKRAVPALPIAGSFRAIDFSLSSMSNSHILIHRICRTPVPVTVVRCDCRCKEE